MKLKSAIFYLTVGVFIFGCGSKVKPVTLVRSFQNSGNWDSVCLYSDGHLVITEHQKRRYFLVSYATRRTGNSDGEVEGSIYLNWSNFPSKGEIDSMAFEMMPLKRECYQNIVISLIFEFTDEADFKSFDKGYKGSPTIIHKKSCENVNPTLTAAPDWRLINRK